MLHWLNVEIWGPMWPNVFAPSIFTLIAVILAHIKTHRHQKKQHEDLKRHVTEQIGQQVGALSVNNFQAKSERLISPSPVYSSSERPRSTSRLQSQENSGRKET